jgi:hypothetical protein
VAVATGAPFLVSQHGLLTPYAPPLPRDSCLLAWTHADADFWASGRSDVTVAVLGSQLLWQVEPTAAPVDAAERPTYLGQLHAAELSRSRLARAAYAFCQAHGATYRPHPSEKDRVSRLLHAGWERRGIRVSSETPLSHLDSPVVSVFSTGVLEAAARGIPAWVDFPDPPMWLAEFWDRYGMRAYGEDPTRALPRSDAEPAAAVARALMEAT